MKFMSLKRKALFRQALPVAIVLLGGAALGAYILTRTTLPAGVEQHAEKADEHGHADEAGHDDAKAPPTKAVNKEDHHEAATAGTASDEAHVTMSDAQATANGVTLASAGPARITTLLALQGEVRLNDERSVHVVPRLGGRVEAVLVQAGASVRSGQVLAVLSSPALADQRSDWLAARQRLGFARSNFEREKTLWEEKISAAQDYQQARHALSEADLAEQSARQKLAALGVSTSAAPASSAALMRHEIRAPIDGVITARNVSVGEVLKDDANIFVVADLSTVWVELTLQAKDLHAVTPGQKAVVSAIDVDARAQASAHGQVAYVSALVDAQTRTASARIVLANPKRLWRPGLPVKVELTAGEVDVALAVSVDALQTLGDRTVVFARRGDKFEARTVQLGRRDARTVEVLSGLGPGERYAVRNSFLIKADVGKAGAEHGH